MTILNVECSASGIQMEVDTENYPAELPSDYGYENDGEDVTWVNWDYAQQDEMFQDDTAALLPEDTPYWVAS